MDPPGSSSDAGNAIVTDEHNNTPPAPTESDLFDAMSLFNLPPAPPFVPLVELTNFSSGAPSESLAKFTPEELASLDNATFLSLLGIEKPPPIFRPSDLDDPDVEKYTDMIENMPIQMLDYTPDDDLDPADEVMIDIKDIQSMCLRFGECITEICEFVGKIEIAVTRLESGFGDPSTNLNQILATRAQLVRHVTLTGGLITNLETSFTDLSHHCNNINGELPNVQECLHAVRVHIDTTKFGIERLELSAKSILVAGTYNQPNNNAGAGPTVESGGLARARQMIRFYLVDVDSVLNGMDVSCKGIRHNTSIIEERFAEMWNTMMDLAGC